MPTRMLLHLLVCLALLHLAVDRAAAQEGRRVRFSFKYTVNAETETKNLSFTSLVPRTVHGRQTVRRISFAPPPQRQFEEEGGQYVQYVFPSITGQQEITIDVRMEIHKYDLSVAQAKADRRRMVDGAPEGLQPFLAEEKYLDIKSEEVGGLAKKVETTDELETVRKLLAAVTDELKQSGYQPNDRGALAVLKAKDGDCTDYADVFISLCRAKGIPARFNEGYVTTPVAENDTPKHDWAEVYLKDLGWVPFDPFHVDLKIVQVDSLPPKYILLSNRRNDPALGQYHFWYYRHDGGTVKISDEYVIHKQSEIK